MELLDRYLNAVKFLLPKDQRDDILAELSEDIRSQIEDEERARGHKLNENEIAAILARRGHPMLVASRYLPQQHLIGPVFFPTYIFVLKLVLLWIMAPAFVGLLLLTAAIPNATVFRILGGIPQAAFTAFGIITLIFAAVERSRVDGRYKVLERWDPRRLPKTQAPPSRTSQAVTEVVSGIVWAPGWVWLVRLHPSIHADQVRISLAPIFTDLFWPILVLMLIRIALGCADIVHARRPRLFDGLRLTVDATGLVVLFVLLVANSWVEYQAPPSLAPRLAEAARWTNMGIRFGLIGITIVVLVQAVQEARRWPGFPYRANRQITG